MLTRIAWRNVWRNKARSGVVIGAMAIGIWALSFGGGFMKSFLVGYIASSIRYETSNGQVHNPEFKKDQEIRYNVPNPSAIVSWLQDQPEVSQISTRSLVNGMISSSRKATGIRIVGIDPADENKVTELASLVHEGDYLDDSTANFVMIGEKLARDLQVGVKAKVVLTFQDISGNITAGRFRVAAILKASALVINEGSAYVRKRDLNRLLGIGNDVHEVAYTTVLDADDETLAERINATFPDVVAESWEELAPALVFMQQMMGATLKILIIIIMSALAFGIVNTMLMAVLERVRELGVLQALGMKRQRIYLMIMLETIFLSTAGGPLGLLIGYLTIIYLGHTGIDLSSYSAGLEAIGYESILYPSLSSGDYLQIVVGVILTALLAALYPAWKAIRYRPAEAIHTL